jgi:hypothetical protein
MPSPDVPLEYAGDVVECAGRFRRDRLLGISLPTAVMIRDTGEQVWVARTRTRFPALRYRKEIPSARLFRASFSRRPHQVMLTPGMQVIVDESLVRAARISLPLSLGWEAFQVLTEKLREKGNDALVALYRRHSARAGAIATCVASVTAIAESRKQAGTLADSDVGELLHAALGVTVAGRKCRDAWVHADAVEPGGRSVFTLAEAERLSEDTEVLERIEQRAGSMARLLRVGRFVLRFARK